jgi:competence ComEA-like helix-hairpin-helix protein
MSEWKEIFEFSRAEVFALAILLLMILVGGGVLLYQNSSQTLPPELFFQSVGATTTSSRSPEVVVPKEPVTATPAKKSTDESRSAKSAERLPLLLNINTAPADSLTLLPRVGKVIGQRIVELRQQLGKFDSVEQLLAVRGIGKKTLELIRPHVCVAPTPVDTSANPDVHSTPN